MLDVLIEPFLLQAIAYACKVSVTCVPELTESEAYEECENHFNEDEELEQLINGQICFKVYPFSSGMVQSLGWLTQITVEYLFYFTWEKYSCTP